MSNKSSDFTQDHISEMNEKLNLFYNELRDKKIIIGFTGGLGSIILYELSKRVAAKICCIFIETRYTSPEDLNSVLKMKEKEPENFRIVERLKLSEEILILNSEDRDFFCKKSILEELEKLKEENGFDLVIDGTPSDKFVNLWDKNPFGDKSKFIYNTINLTRQDLNFIAEKNDINFERNPELHLLTRFRYGIPITEELLAIVEQTEMFIKSLLSLKVVRLRIFDRKHCVIEVNKKDIQKIVNEKIRIQIFEKLREYEFDSISIDLAGYRRNNLLKTKN